MTISPSSYEEYYTRYAPRTHGLPTPVPLHDFPRGRDFYKKLGEPKKIVAPMVDQSELAWRTLARRYGAELCYTPMIHARLYSRPSKNDAFQQRQFATLPSDGPLIAQFCGNNPKEILAAAEMIQDKCDAVDLNLGCPQGIAKKGFYGSFLQNEWDLVYDIISTLHINLRVPVCAKIRIFKDPAKTLAYAKHVCSAGVSILSVHGRTREMKGQLTGIADWDMIRQIRQVIPPEVVMFANGNIQYHEDLERCLQFTGVDGVMSAEGHLHNPAIFVDPRGSFEDKFPRIDRIAREYLEIVRELDDPCSNIAVKAHLFALFRVAFEEHKDMRNLLGASKGCEESMNVISIMEERIDKEIQETGEDKMGGDIPWYRCQPYIRPDRLVNTENKENEKVEVRQVEVDMEVA